jgi:hypothetical protein
MPKLRQPPGPDAGAPLSPEVEPLPLDVVIDGPRPGRVHPEADRVWLDLRAALGRASEGGPYDPRHILAMPAALLASWRERRRAWAADLLADDPRVEVDG